MEYDAVEAAIRRAIDAADEERLRAFAADAVLRLTGDDDRLGTVPGRELTGPAWQALHAAHRDVLTAGPAELRRHLDTVDAGVLSDGDMDPDLLLTVTALDSWTGLLETGDRRHVFDLSIRLIEVVERDVEDADPVDFLASRAVAAEYARITGALT
ncbi:hypothetical protein Daura_19280 [Dactylosporangium aurantiacum]|uniref:Uncharacterized protein n=1 Tax=Dactylosporangium aurantiacum TaxID=35754 RepID=A0A9Q9MIN6_9ACTN|nr:hypothetical protein [Dactylosporangium aurantiacum]MDG6109883.1 hypothetical protein [Dactylosporangium aurantiacum]UWZ58119.1 hypothetical protein Daura_19280 [Dactylosporangium aurantiacum]